jgi:hypothetical protein
MVVPRGVHRAGILILAMAYLFDMLSEDIQKDVSSNPKRHRAMLLCLVRSFKGKSASPS